MSDVDELIEKYVDVSLYRQISYCVSTDEARKIVTLLQELRDARKTLANLRERVEGLKKPQTVGRDYLRDRYFNETLVEVLQIIEGKE